MPTASKPIVRFTKLVEPTWSWIDRNAPDFGPIGSSAGGIVAINPATIAAITSLARSQYSIDLGSIASGGKDVTVKACGTCHEPRRAASVRLTREGWAAVIESMRARGARVSDEEFPVVLDYLATNFAGEAPQPLNLNRATQIDLEAAGGLLRREAAAVIRYRDEHGPFKSLEDLRNVPGLDYAKIERRKDAMVVM